MAESGNAVKNVIQKNDNYSKKIIEDAVKGYNLQQLKQKKPKLEGKDEYLEEGKKQVAELCNGIEGLAFNTDLHIVDLHVKLGQILNDIKDWLSENSNMTLTQWADKNFSHKHKRYFYQARQLANMGEQVHGYAYLGKNRLLEFEAIRKKINDIEKEEKPEWKDLTFDNIAQKFKNDGDLSLSSNKRHIDAVITYYRFKYPNANSKSQQNGSNGNGQNTKGEGLDIKFDQALAYVDFSRGSATVSNVKNIMNILKGKSNEEKKEIFAQYIDNKGKFPEDLKKELQPKIMAKSPDTLLEGFIKYCEKIDFDDSELLSKLKDRTNIEDIKKAYKKIKKLAEGLGIELSSDTKSSEKTESE